MWNHHEHIADEAVKDTIYSTDVITEINACTREICEPRSLPVLSAKLLQKLCTSRLFELCSTLGRCTPDDAFDADRYFIRCTPKKRKKHQCFPLNSSAYMRRAKRRAWWVMPRISSRNRQNWNGFAHCAPAFTFRSGNINLYLNPYVAANQSEIKRMHRSRL